MMSNNEAAKIAGTLSAEEWKALEYVQVHGSYLIYDEDEPLTNFDRVFLKGLLNKIYNQDGPRYFLNVYGNAVLETHETPPAESGKAMSITAAEIGAALSQNDWFHLQRASEGNRLSSAARKNLVDLSLVTYDPVFDECPLTDLGKRVLEARETAAESEKPSTITAERLVANLGEWALLKDAQKIHLLWAGEYIDGIAQVASDRYAIQYGGELEPDYVTGETLIGIEWLTKQLPPATAADSGAGEAQTFAELCEREIVKIRELTLKDDAYTGGLLGEAVGSPTGITMCVEARMKQIADLQSEVERLKKQVKKLKRTADLDDGFIDYLTQESVE